MSSNVTVIPILICPFETVQGEITTTCALNQVHTICLHNHLLNIGTRLKNYITKICHKTHPFLVLDSAGRVMPQWAADQTVNSGEYWQRVCDIAPVLTNQVI
jgi:hypothetical protein